MYTLNLLLQHINIEKSMLADADAEISRLDYDTRKIRVGKGSLFFALIHQRDGHQYIAEAYDKGVRSFVISDTQFDRTNYEGANFLLVKDTLKTIQEIAAFHRNHFSYPIIGITGSNGKTIVKEWLFQLLRQEYKCYQSPKSYNSQLGVALSLWNLSDEYNLAIIEAGISETQEMKSLQEMIRPTMGIFTSLGTAHREGFDSKEQKFSEKWKLFETAEEIIAAEVVYEFVEETQAKLSTWGRSTINDLLITGDNTLENSKVLSLVYESTAFDLEIPFTDQASVENVLTCVLTMLQLDYAIEVIQERIKLLKPLEMRLQLKKGKNNSSIIDDTYSNDLASLQIALDFLGQQNQSAQHKLILSDFEGEEWTSKFEQKLVQILNSYQLNQIILVGERLKAVVQQLEAEVFHYNSTNDLLAAVDKIPFQNATVLLKGARKYQLEKVSSMLVQKSHDTVLEINLKSIEHNIKQYRSKLKDGVKMMAMVKAFSYGSGSFEVANILQYNKVDYLTVAFADEGVELREGGIRLPIMVMSPHNSTFADLVHYNLEPEIYSFSVLAAFIHYLSDEGIADYPIHVKLDTGMHRLGFVPEDMPLLIQKITSSPQIQVASVFSHLVSAGNPQLLDFTNQQISLFRALSTELEHALGYTILKHICNTSGIVHHSDAQMDMVRLGIGMYGFDMVDNDLTLEGVGTLKTTITQIKNLKQSETVGYDRKGVLQRDSTIATVKIGYADGYDRRFGNGVGQMLINGKLVPTVGSICMDMCMLDITDLEANEGEDVLVFPDIRKAAQDIATIPYELLTNVSSRVKRVYFYE